MPLLLLRTFFPTAFGEQKTVDGERTSEREEERKHINGRQGKHALAICELIFKIILFMRFVALQGCTS